MPIYDVLKPLQLGKVMKRPGETVELDVRRGDWLAKQHQAVRLRAGDSAALTHPKPKLGRCCGR